MVLLSRGGAVRLITGAARRSEGNIVNAAVSLAAKRIKGLDIGNLSYFRKSLP